MTAEEIKERMHKWIMKDISWYRYQVCERCGATRWSIPGGWSRAKDGNGLPKRWCDK